MDVLITKYNPDRLKYLTEEDEFRFFFQSFISVRLLPDAVRNSANYDFVCITSHRAVDWVVKYGLQLFNKSHFVCLSHKQAERLESVKLRAKVIPGGDLEHIKAWLAEQSADLKVLILKGKRSLLPKIDSCDESIVYETTLLPAAVRIKQFNAILFFSPSGVEGFVEGGNLLPKDCHVFALGETTAKSVKNHLTNKVFISPVQEEEAFIQFVKDELSVREK